MKNQKNNENQTFKTKTFYSKLLCFYGSARNFSEDKTVLKHLKTLPTNSTYLEVGSGLGRFVNLVKDKFDFSLQAIEINKDLADLTTNKGISTINSNFLDNTFKDDQFDVVHCSHVIEHVAFPDITFFLDELLRITKNNGYVILRSPLPTNDFLTNIDHIRPYPPKAILNYFSNSQQQKVGSYQITPIKIKIRHKPISIGDFSCNSFIRIINLLFKLLWACFRFPFGKADGYVLILKKINKTT